MRAKFVNEYATTPEKRGYEKYLNSINSLDKELIEASEDKETWAVIYGDPEDGEEWKGKKTFPSKKEIIGWTKWNIQKCDGGCPFNNDGDTDTQWEYYSNISEADLDFSLFEKYRGKYLNLYHAYFDCRINAYGDVGPLEWWVENENKDKMYLDLKIGYNKAAPSKN